MTIDGSLFKLLADEITATGQQAFHDFVENYKTQNNLDAVLLACTELPVVYGSIADPTVVSILDVLADGLLDYYFAHL